jgi:hypothetical protein
MIKSENGRIQMDGTGGELNADFMLVVDSMKGLYMKIGMTKEFANDIISEMVNRILDMEPDELGKGELQNEADQKADSRPEEPTF